MTGESQIEVGRMKSGEPAILARIDGGSWALALTEEEALCVGERLMQAAEESMADGGEDSSP